MRQVPKKHQVRKTIISPIREKAGILWHKRKTVVLATLLLLLSVTLFAPIATVKALLVDTGITPSNGFFSMDSGRIAFTVETGVAVYDTRSGTVTSFANPPGLALPPSLSGDKVVVATGSSIIAPMTLHYCTLPHASPIQPCGPWTAIVSGLPSLAQQAGFGSFPQINGDIVVYVRVGGFGYYRFSSGTNSTVTTPTQPHGLSTSGEIIAFSAKPTATSPSETIRYYDTTVPAESRVVVDTALPGIYPSISQHTVAFNDNSTTAERVRYYDIIRNEASPAGTGPFGEIFYANSPFIWNDRISLRVNEVDANFDCNGSGTKLESEYCLGYWNIRGPSWVVTTLAGKAAPAVNSYAVIYDKIIAFQGTNGHLQYVTVPMKGDVNLDGVVDNTDKSIVIGCVGELLKGSVC